MWRSMLTLGRTVVLALTVLGAIACNKGESPLMPTLELIHSETQFVAVLDAFLPVTAGQAVAEAAPYAGAGPHPLVLLASSGARHNWTYQVPSEWWPTSVAETQLVASVGEQSKYVSESATYIGCEGQVKSYGWTVEVTLREARTGRVVASWWFQTSPRTLPETITDCGYKSESDPVEFPPVRDWLHQYVAGRAG